MLQGINTLGFFENIENQRFNNSDIQDICVIFETGKIPAFICLTDTASNASVQVFNKCTGESVGEAQNVVITATNDKKQLTYIGGTIGDTDEGYYYLKLIVDTTIYYSEVFKWQQDVSDLLKITATSANLTINNEYEIDLTDFTYECYLLVEKNEIKKDINESGIEKPYGNIPYFNTFNLIGSYETLGTIDIYIFLSFLRILETNGIIYFSFEGRTKEVHDIVTKKEDNSNADETIVISVEYREKNYISSRNEG